MISFAFSPKISLIFAISFSNWSSGTPLSGDAYHSPSRRQSPLVDLKSSLISNLEMMVSKEKV